MDETVCLEEEPRFSGRVLGHVHHSKGTLRDSHLAIAVTMTRSTESGESRVRKMLLNNGKGMLLIDQSISGSS